MTPLRIPAVYMRGGTSKGVFFLAGDLPADRAARDRILLRVVGSPDPYGKQIDGMGAATSSTSKVVIVSRSSRPDCDVDYLFGQVAIDAPVIDWSGNCGNLTGAVGPFAIGAGLLATPADGMATVRIWQANIGNKIVAHVPMRGGEVVESGDFRLDGVAFPGAEVRLEFIDPAGKDSPSGGGATFPSGHEIDRLEIPGLGIVEATLINAGNPTVFVDAAALGLQGTELQQDVNGRKELLELAETVRSRGAVAMGLATTAEEATAKRPHTPKARLHREAGRVHRLRREAHRSAVDRPPGADLFHGAASSCDDRHGRRRHRRRSGHLRNDRASHRGSVGEWQRAFRPSLRDSQRRGRSGPPGRALGHQQGDREPIGAQADGRPGLRAGRLTGRRSPCGPYASNSTGVRKSFAESI